MILQSQVGEIIDLYSKFLIAFIGIVTPALAIYLNNYLIDRSKFEELVISENKIASEVISRQTKDLQNTDDGNFEKTSNDLLTKRREKLRNWEMIVKKLDPLRFFTINVSLLATTLLFLFLWLFIRAKKAAFADLSCYTCAQMLTCFVSVILCLWHIINLIRIGVYLIKVRPTVDEINSEIKLYNSSSKDDATEIVL